MARTELSETRLVEQKDLREQMIDKVEVLEKVKELFLIPDMEVMTTKMVADYYEVDMDAIRKIYQRNKGEISADGAAFKSTKEIMDFCAGQNVQYKTQVAGRFLIYDDISIWIPNSGTSIFSKRAILRIGMLLRDSKVAREVRTQLLNTFEHSTVKQRTNEIDEELLLFVEIGKANAVGTKDDIQIANRKYIDYKNRHITQLKEENLKLSQINENLEVTNKVLTKGIMTWGDSAILNALVRKLSYKSFHNNFKYAWNCLYRQIHYRLGINVHAREGGEKLINRIRSNEMKDVVSVAAAICKEHGINIGQVVNEINAENIKMN